jgi:diguanylate cyclase (GGDEF)-like protein
MNQVQFSRSIKQSLLADSPCFNEALSSLQSNYGENPEFYSTLIRLLAQKVIEPPKAREIFTAALDLQRQLSDNIGRSVDFRSALMEYLLSIESLYTFPTVVEHHEYEKQQSHALTDFLTGLSNRRYFESKFVQEVHRAGRHKYSTALVFVDIDDFKRINDEYGHKAGDLALIRAARCLQKNARIEDLIARYGGEEFAAVLPHTNAEGAMVFAHRLRLAISSMRLPFSFTLSAGVAVFPQDGERSRLLMDAADQRMYQAKSCGKNRVVGPKNL